MKLFNNNNNKPNISIDFGSSEIKVIEGQATKANINITKSQSLQIPKGVYSDGRILNEDKLINIFRDFLQTNKFKMDLKAYGVINSSSIIIREINIPKVEEGEISSLINFQVEEFLPINPEDYVIDYLLLDKVEEDKLNILLIAIPKGIVLSHLNLMKEVGLEPVALDHQGNTVAKLLSFNDNINNEYTIKDNTIVSVDLGYTKTEVTISINSNIEVLRAIDSGARNIYEIMDEFLGFTEDEVEIQIRNIENISKIDDINEDNKLEIIYKSSLEGIMDKVGKIIRYYDSREFGNRVHLIVLQGGLSNIEGIEKLFKKHFHINTVKLNSLDKIKLDENISLYANSIGALIRRDEVHR